MNPHNRVELTGVVSALETLRYTPAGIPIVELKLDHESPQEEAGKTRTVKCEVAAVAAGQVAQRMVQAQLGARIKVTGFLAHRGKSKVHLVLHINEFEFI
ncbi:MAG: restart primosome assembly protein PriB [Betaproteobacteria bacterium]|nr:restart primosome assembly protein PriB [Betaproteobacteria bacterium]